MRDLVCKIDSYVTHYNVLPAGPSSGPPLQSQSSISLNAFVKLFMGHYTRVVMITRKSLLIFLPRIIGLLFTLLIGCRHAPVTSATALHNPTDCLPDINLLDAHAQTVSLARLKKKPVLFDFIYTSCQGECLLLTDRMRKIADQLGPALGHQVQMVSITIDPEHDGPAQLLDYSKNQAADLNGWIFLTGKPAQVDAVMTRFRLVRTRENEGDLDHVPAFFLVNAKGRAIVEYPGEKVDPEEVARDIDQITAGKPISTADGVMAQSDQAPE